MKLLSVIIPLYNSARWLPKCLDSVLSQDIAEEDLEIICINDGSPDGSEQIARQYQVEHPTSIVVLSQENQGPSGARNNGMKHASGKYLCFVDPDDYVEPNVFGELLRKMEDQQLDMLRFDYRIVDEGYQPVNKREFELAFDYSPCVMSGAEFLANRLDYACNIWMYFYRADVIVKNDIWCFTGDYFDDTPWLPLVLLRSDRLGICDTVVYDYQERSDSLVKATNLVQIKKKNKGYMLLLRLLLEEMKGINGGEEEHDSMKVIKGVRLSNSVREGIVTWYKMMLTHSVLSLLTSTAVYDFELRNVVLKELKNHGVFPLSSYRALPKNVGKIRLFNVCPKLAMRMVRMKQKL